MKNYLFILLAILPAFCFAQNREKLPTVNPLYSEVLPVDESGIITYSEIVEVSKASKDELFLLANDWILKRFNSPKDAVQFSDKQAGKVVCKTITGIEFGKGWSKIKIEPVYYLLTIETKDGRYRITASNFIHHNEVQLGMVQKSADNPLEQYFKIKNPTKKEIDINTEAGTVLKENIRAIFDDAKQNIIKKSDNW